MPIIICACFTELADASIAKIACVFLIAYSATKGGLALDSFV